MFSPWKLGEKKGESLPFAEAVAIPSLGGVVVAAGWFPAPAGVLLEGKRSSAKLTAPDLMV